MSWRFGAIGDLHLQKLNTVLPGDSVGLQLSMIEQALNRARRLNIKWMFQAGDLFDTSHPDDSSKLRLLDLLRRYPDIRWIVIPGNHDRPIVDQHSMRLLHWCGQNEAAPLEVILEPTVREIDGARIFFCPHPYIEDQPREADFSIGHFPWNGARRDNGSREQTGSAPRGTWILGDFHAAQRGPRFRYLGSAMQLTWFESKAKGFEVLHGSRGALRATPIPLRPAYRLSQLEVKSLADLEQIDPLDGQHYYRLLVHPDVELPADWQRQYPTAIRRLPFGKAEKAAATLVRVNLSDDPFERLTDWLRDRKRLSPAQIEWACKYTERRLRPSLVE